MDRGLLRRAPDPLQARAQRLTLTPKGRRVLRAIRSRQREHLERSLADWPARDIQVFSALFVKFVTGMTAPTKSRNLLRAVASSSDSRRSRNDGGTRR